MKIWISFLTLCLFLSSVVPVTAAPRTRNSRLSIEAKKRDSREKAKEKLDIQDRFEKLRKRMKAARPEGAAGEDEGKSLKRFSSQYLLKVKQQNQKRSKVTTRSQFGNSLLRQSKTTNKHNTSDPFRNTRDRIQKLRE